MIQDFNNLNRDLRIGAVFVFVLTLSVLVGAVWVIIRLKEEIKLLNEDIIVIEASLNESKKKSYDRFVIAMDLTDICNRFKSSREAKEKYYLNK